MSMIGKTWFALAASFGLAAAAIAAPADPGLERFRAIYKELVETNTTLSAGDCTLAARRMAERLKAAGYPDSDLTIFVPDGHPKEGGLIAVLHGTNPRAKAILMLAHVDVVEAKREDWTRDPFTLIEEGGYYYGRGTSDMKAQAAIWVDNLIRYREEGFKPKRTIKLALTCGEETNHALNGAGWLVEHMRQAIDAEFAITEGVDGERDASGKKLALGVLAAEKVSQNYTFEVTNRGGHSSRPVADNAIYHLVRAVDRVSRYEFPVQLNDANRAYLLGMATILGGEKGAAMAAVAKNPADLDAVAILDKDVNVHAMLRTTCVATLLEAGHATNALPQRARANINCRIFPGVSRETIQAALTRLVDDPAVAVTVREVRGPLAAATPLTPRIMGPVAAVAHELWPGVPVVAALEPGASDAQFLNPAGIPTYGITGLFTDADGGGIHGLNERIPVQSVTEGRTFLYRLVKRYANE
jgi:acetylornithine deacetylase/succinyl-diaminopimelate desuccinylase-like protein